MESSRKSKSVLSVYLKNRSTAARSMVTGAGGSEERKRRP
jgi:hypothetical protein